MAAVGRKPKPEDQRRNRSQPTHDWIDVLDVPYDGEVPNPGRLPSATKRWWGVVSRMPHCVIWTESDWQEAIEACLIHAEWTRTKKAGLTAELRLRSKGLGLTWFDRRDLRIRYVEGVTEAVDPSPISIEDRRKALQG